MKTDVRRHIRPFFLSPDGQYPTPYKPYYDILSYLTTQLAFSFTTTPFVLLTLPDSLRVWSRVYFYAILGTAASMAFFASPAKAYMSRVLKKRNQSAVPQSKPEKVRLGPLMGLPSDPAGDIDEAVREIREEVEARRRRGLGGSMPTGVDMKVAVEEKLGKKT